MPGIQTITNCPGEKTSDLSKIKVRVVELSRFTRTIVTAKGRESDMGAPHEVFCLETFFTIEFFFDGLEDIDIIVNCAADLNSPRTRHDHLNYIISGGDPPAPDDRNRTGFIEFVDAPDRNREHGRPGEAAEPVAEDRTPAG
jgi:hypothetical protein